MPGLKDRDDKLATFLTGAVLHRTGVSAIDDAGAFNAAPVIDLSPNLSAAGNAIHVIATRTAGAGWASIELWRKLTRDSTAHTAWIKVETANAVPDASEVRFTNLVAAQYKLKVTGVNASTWDFHEYHTQD